MRTARSAIGRTAAGLGIGAAASSVLAIADGPPWGLVALGGTGTLVLFVLAAAAVTAGLLESRVLIVLAGAGFLASAVVQLVQIAWTGANLLGGDGSTVALLLGFAAGLLALGLTPAPDDRDIPTSATGRRDAA